MVGAGLAGLACTVRLRERGFHVLLLEASDAAGGRVRTDQYAGFQLDRGFQVLLTAYPETSRTLNYSSLSLSLFRSGALVRLRGRFVRVADPVREPSSLLSTVVSPIGTVGDKLKIGRLLAETTLPSLERVFSRPEMTTEDRLRKLGFSESIRSQFFRPFFGGIFLENQLQTSSRKFDFVFRMFAKGFAALPAAGIGTIPAQLLSRLDHKQVRFHSAVASLHPGAVRIDNGEELRADEIIVAVDPWSSAQLLLGPKPILPTASATCLYYSSSSTPVRGRWLVLNGERSGPINNLCVLSEVHASYAPQGLSLISVTVLDPHYQESSDIENHVRSQLHSWYGPDVANWQHLRTYKIRQAVPIQTAGSLSPVQKPIQSSAGIYHCDASSGIVSIEGAIDSGLRLAECISH